MLSEKDVRNAITAAWADQVPPADSDLVSRTWGEYGDCLEAFSGRPWMSLSYQEMFFHRACRTFFLPKGLAYYLPAYMFASISEMVIASTSKNIFEQFQWDITEETLSAIEKVVTDPAMPRLGVTSSQLLAINKYLEFILQFDLASTAADDVLECLAIVKKAAP